MITCKTCGAENHGYSIFCRQCLEQVKNFLIDEGYIQETFHRLRKQAVLLVLDESDSDDFNDFIESLRTIIIRSMSEVEKLEASPELMVFIREQRNLTFEGLNLYLEALDLISSTIDPVDSDMDQSIALLQGLELAEEGNHKLNEAMRIIENQENLGNLYADDELA